MTFRWNAWNLEHIDKHGVAPREVEEVVRRARAPYPTPCGNDKWRVCGQTHVGRYLQVIYVLDVDGTTYVIHARSLTEREKHSFRRRRR